MDYQAAASIAARLIGENGQVMMLTRIGNTAYDTATSSAGSVELEYATTVGAMFGYSLHRAQGTLIEAGDKRIMLSAIELAAPKPGDTITLGEENVWRIVAVNTMAPAGIPIYHECQVRQ